MSTGKNKKTNTRNANKTPKGDTMPITNNTPQPEALPSLEDIFTSSQTTVECYNALIDTIKQIPIDELETSSKPMETYTHEAGRTQWALEAHLSDFEEKKFPIENALDLEKRIGALREAQGRYMIFKNGGSGAQQYWAEHSPTAFELRDDLLATMKFACRKNSTHTKTLKEISKGSTISDMIQDLVDLTILGKEITVELEAVGADLSLIDTAAQQVNALTKIQRMAEEDRKSNSEVRTIRDQAYTYTHQLVVEVREWAGHIFRKQPEILKEFTSNYYKAKNSKTRKSPEPVAVDGGASAE